MITFNVPDKDDIRVIVREEVADIREEQRKQGVLLEDLSGKFDHVTELLSDNLKVQNQVRDHDKRVAKLEADSAMAKSTLAHHSMQLKALS